MNEGVGQLHHPFWGVSAMYETAAILGGAVFGEDSGYLMNRSFHNNRA